MNEPEQALEERATPVSKALVKVRGREAGVLSRVLDGFTFDYFPDYLAEPTFRAVSQTLPKRSTPFRSPVLFPFFAGLLAEGNLAVLQCRLFRIDEEDLFTRLVRTAGMDVIGCVTVHPLPAAKPAKTA